MAPLFDTKHAGESEPGFEASCRSSEGHPWPSAARLAGLRARAPSRRNEAPPLAWRGPRDRFLLGTHEAHLRWTYLLPPEAGRLPSPVFSGGPAAGPGPAGTKAAVGRGCEGTGRRGQGQCGPISGPARPGHGGEQCFLLPGWRTGADRDGAPAREDTGPPSAVRVGTSPNAATGRSWFSRDRLTRAYCSSPLTTVSHVKGEGPEGHHRMELPPSLTLRGAGQPWRRSPDWQHLPISVA